MDDGSVRAPSMRSIRAAPGHHVTKSDANTKRAHSTAHKQRSQKVEKCGWAGEDPERDSPDAEIWNISH
eukprot:5401763-Pyramimonas_sp.AAC.1